MGKRLLFGILLIPFVLIDAVILMPIFCIKWIIDGKEFEPGILLQWLFGLIED